MIYWSKTRPNANTKVTYTNQDGEQKISSLSIPVPTVWEAIKQWFRMKIK